MTAKNREEVQSATITEIQIFKITEDLGESNDLSSSMPEKAAELTERLNEHYRALVAESHVWEKK